jgi:membrane-associated phospholipid phosphatase
MKNPIDNIDRETRHFLAEIISWSFFPPLVATVFFIFLIFWYSADLAEGVKWVTYISPFLIFVPLVFFAISFKLGWVSDIDLSDRKQRPLYLIVFIAGMFIASAILYLLNVPLKFFVYTFSGLVMTVITTFITLFWKISFHTAITTSVVTAITILGGIRYAPFFILIPIIGWARVVLKKHTVWQVIGGFAVALLVTEAIFYAFGFRLFI